jgi:hypothetical protein
MKKQEVSSPIIINEVNIRSVDRGKKDIASWRNALTGAESVYFPNRTRLYDLYEDILLDGHLSGVITKKINAVLNKGIFFEVNGGHLPEMDSLIHSLEFRDIVRTIIETLLWGISAIEFIPGPALAYNLLPRKHIKPEAGVISYEQSGNEGITYVGRENVWVIGHPRDLGLLLKCAPYCLYKRGGLADWAQYIELFGQPVRVIKYDSYDEQTRAELRKILDESGSSLSMMIPRQADFEIKDGKQSNSDGGLQLSFIKALNEEISVTVLGNTETTNSSRSAGYAQSKIHQEQQYEITRADIAYTTAVLNSPQFLSLLRSYGYPVDGGAFTFTKDMDVDYLHKRIAIDKELAALVSIPESYWFDTYGISPGK